VRTERRGVPIEGTLRGSVFDLANRVRRLIRRDHAWLIRVRAKGNDPFGPDAYEEIVDDERQLPGALEAVVERVRSGAIGAASDQDAFG